jgi:hypothetical protein
MGYLHGSLWLMSKITAHPNVNTTPTTHTYLYGTRIMVRIQYSDVGDSCFFFLGASDKLQTNRRGKSL